jgi:hypothetical protein
MPIHADRDAHPVEINRIADDHHDPLGTVSGDRTSSYPLEPVGPEFALDAWRRDGLDAASQAQTTRLLRPVRCIACAI